MLVSGLHTWDVSAVHWAHALRGTDNTTNSIATPATMTEDIPMNEIAVNPRH
jgi:hypothetical protein